MNGQPHHWQDARLKKALDNAPDAQVKPDDQTRASILKAAKRAVEQSTSSTPPIKANWLERISQYLFGSPRMAWSAVGSFLVVGFIALLWTVNDPNQALDQGDILRDNVPMPAPVAVTQDEDVHTTGIKEPVQTAEAPPEEDITTAILGTVTESSPAADDRSEEFVTAPSPVASEDKEKEKLEQEQRHHSTQTRPYNTSDKKTSEASVQKAKKNTASDVYMEIDAGAAKDKVQHENKEIVKTVPKAPPQHEAPIYSNEDEVYAPSAFPSSVNIQTGTAPSTSHVTATERNLELEQKKMTPQTPPSVAEQSIPDQFAKNTATQDFAPQPPVAAAQEYPVRKIHTESLPEAWVRASARDDFAAGQDAAPFDSRKNQEKEDVGRYSMGTSTSKPHTLSPQADGISVIAGGKGMAEQDLRREDTSAIRSTGSVSQIVPGWDQVKVTLPDSSITQMLTRQQASQLHSLLVGTLNANAANELPAQQFKPTGKQLKLRLLSQGRLVATIYLDNQNWYLVSPAGGKVLKGPQGQQQLKRFTDYFNNLN